jgi:hypothetical protein
LDLGVFIYAHGLQDPIRTYEEMTIRKLNELSKKYDPEGVFQKLRWSGLEVLVN